MDARTLKALRGSIAKWERIVAGTGVDHGSVNCPLCQLFLGEYHPTKHQPCYGCPVSEAVDDYYCDSTPYANISNEHDDERYFQHAQEELDFLKSLLPAEETTDAAAADC